MDQPPTISLSLCIVRKKTFHKTYYHLSSNPTSCFNQKTQSPSLPLSLKHHQSTKVWYIPYHTTPHHQNNTTIDIDTDTDTDTDTDKTAIISHYPHPIHSTQLILAASLYTAHLQNKQTNKLFHKLSLFPFFLLLSSSRKKKPCHSPGLELDMELATDIRI